MYQTRCSAAPCCDSVPCSAAHRTMIFAVCGRGRAGVPSVEMLIWSVRRMALFASCDVGHAAAEMNRAFLGEMIFLASS